MTGSSRTYAFGPFLLDVADHRLTREGKQVPLTPKAFTTLCTLVANHDHAVSKEQLIEAVWPDSIVEENNLSQNISFLRKLLCDEHGTEYISTLPKHGYRFDAPVSEMAANLLKLSSETDVPFRPPETHYARSGDVSIAYQVLGDGPVDLVFVMGWLSHLEYFWTEPSFARFLLRLSSFARLILFDKRGTGLSDRVPVSQLPTLEQRMDDVRAVLEAVGSSRAILCGVSEGGPMSALFAATYPHLTAGLIMIGTYARRLRAHDYPWGLTPEQHEQFLNHIEATWGGPVGIETRAPGRMSDMHFREWWASYLRMSASPGAAVAVTKMNAQIDVRQVLPSVRVPALVLHRTGDQCLLVEEGRYVASLMPQARFVELHGNDHLPFVGDQDEVLSNIEQFVAGLRHADSPDRVFATVLYLNTQQPLGTGAWEAYESQMRRHVDWYGGRSVLAYPSSPAATFDGPGRAIRCACLLSDMARRMSLPIGIGLHTGECESPAVGQIRGMAVQVTRRVASLASAGEVLVSSAVRDLVAGSPFLFETRERNVFEVRREKGCAAPGV